MPTEVKTPLMIPAVDPRDRAAGRASVIKARELSAAPVATTFSADADPVSAPSKPPGAAAVEFCATKRKMSANPHAPTLVPKISRRPAVEIPESSASPEPFPPKAACIIQLM